MEHDVDKSELEQLKKQTLDKTEWGGFEQIVMWNRMCRINIEIYCYSMDMQTVDGDEFIQYKYCIRLLYCNEGRWGEQENHYDLMRLIEK
eukprot:13189962-Heterocapsa_arctica.AAC.1